MQCSGCGKPLREGVSVCLRCGTPVPKHPDSISTPAPVGYALMPDPVLPSGGNWESTSIPAGPYDGTQPTQPPPPPPDTYNGFGTTPFPFVHRKRHIPLWQTIITGVALFALVIGGIGVSYALNVFPRIPLLWNSHTTASRCSQPHVNTSINAISNVQLASALTTNNLPLNQTSTFKLQQTVFVAFILTTNDSGKLSADWCLGPQGLTRNYSIPVDADKKGSAGYMDLEKLDSSTLGTGLVDLRWNGVIVAVRNFTVTT
jgi:hypothetical protein